jgi:DNA-binding beta-propeller fold protein YncE
MSSLLVQGQVIVRAWETDSVLKIPESVLYNEQTNQIYVSNINGKPSEKDGNGFISLMDTTGKIISLKWITGMDAPKGMAVYHDTLFVTDIDRVRLISLQDARIIKTIEAEGASFLNDIVVAEDGTAYITDTQKSKIFRLAGGQIESWLEDDKLAVANGLALFNDGNLAVGVKNSVLKVFIKSKNIKLIIDETGPVDGIIHLENNKFIISNWEGRILLASPSEKIVLYSKTEENKQTADLGYIPDKQIVLVPTFNDNRVIAARLVKLK